MKTLIFEVNIHSVVDLITNSSSEIFMIDVTTSNKTLKELFETIVEAAGSGNGGYSETSIQAFSDYEWKEDYITKGINTKNLYIVNIDNNDSGITEALLRKFFKVVELESK